MDEFANPTIRPEIQIKLDEWSSKIIELKNLAATILKYDLKSQTGGDENLPFFFMMRNTVELLDSIAILIKNSSVQPSKLILRGLLENYFNLEYLTKENTKQRSFQFVGSYYYSKLKFYKKLDSSTQSHRSYKQPFERDKRIGAYSFSQPPQLKKAIENLENLFNKADYEPIKKEIQRLKKEEKVNNPSWFRLFGGPKSIIGLSNKIDLEGLYNSYYRWLSGHIHGTDIIEGNLSADQNGKLEVLQIRIPFEAQEITNITMNIGLFIIQQYTNKRIPEYKDHYLKWYKENRDFYRKMSEKNTIVNDEKQEMAPANKRS